MKKNNLKKIIGSIVLIGIIGIGISAFKNINAKANSNTNYGMNQNQQNVEVYGYFPYGISPNGTKIFRNKEEINDYLKQGILNEKEAELEIMFLEAKNDEEKEEVFKKIIDNSMEMYGLNNEQAEMIKNGGYKNFNENLDKIYYESLVENNLISKKEAELQLKIYAAKNKDDREKAYVELIKNMLDENKIDEFEANKLIEDGYTNFSKNMENIKYNKTLNELKESGYITEETFNEFKNRTDENKFYDLKELYSKCEIERSID